MPKNNLFDTDFIPGFEIPTNEFQIYYMYFSSHHLLFYRKKTMSTVEFVHGGQCWIVKIFFVCGEVNSWVTGNGVHFSAIQFNTLLTIRGLGTMLIPKYRV